MRPTFHPERTFRDAKALTRSGFPTSRSRSRHKGQLRDFARMRYDLAGQMRPEFASRLEGTTDSEWL